MTTFQKYQTKRYDCFKRAKELRAEYLSDLLNAKQRGKKVLMVNAETMFGLWSGFPDLQMYWPTGRIQDILATEPGLTTEYLEQAEARGYREICAWIMAPFGEMLSPRGKVKPDIMVTHHVCEPMCKAEQVIADVMGIPGFAFEMPRLPQGQLRDFHFKYFLAQLHDAIEWMEKTTGTKCDDEALCLGVQNERETLVLLAKVLDLNRAIPAPLDFKLCASLTWPAWVEARRSRTVEYMRTLYDETKYRVEHKIAAVANERKRLFHEAAPPFPAMSLLQVGHKYGAVFIGGSTLMIYPPAYKVAEDGSLIVGPTVQEEGLKLKTRDDALRALAATHLYYSPVGPWMSLLPREQITLKAAKDWHIDGIVFHMDRGCQGMPAGMTEVQLACKQAGLATMIYEANSVDSRGFAESQILDSFESFFGTLGLTKLED